MNVVWILAIVLVAVAFLVTLWRIVRNEPDRLGHSDEDTLGGTRPPTQR